MPRITLTLPESDEPVSEQLGRLLGDLPVLPSGSLDSRTVTLTGDRVFLIAALYICLHPDYLRAHELVADIEEVR